MGCVFSCLATSLIYVGELLQEICLALGEISAVVVRAVFGLFVTFFDILATISCCWRVPWDERPDRSTYVYRAEVLSDVGGKKVLSSRFTREGRAQRRQIKAAKKKELELEAEAKAAARKTEEPVSEKQAPTTAAAEPTVATNQVAADAEPKAEPGAEARMETEPAKVETTATA
ncbi:hypothetical protein ACQY0O_004393 [Thecaphora frezii]